MSIADLPGKRASDSEVKQVLMKLSLQGLQFPALIIFSTPDFVIPGM